MSENIQNNGEQVDAVILSLLELHAEEVTLDTQEFLDLLKHSLSLNTMEKKRVIDAAETLSQFQFDELTKVFVEERGKFRELAQEHPEDIKKLLVKQQNEWNELGEIYEREQVQKSQQSEEATQIDDIKAGLGL